MLRQAEPFQDESLLLRAVARSPEIGDGQARHPSELGRHQLVVGDVQALDERVADDHDVGFRQGMFITETFGVVGHVRFVNGLRSRAREARKLAAHEPCGARGSPRRGRRSGRGRACGCAASMRPSGSGTRRDNPPGRAARAVPRARSPGRGRSSPRGTARRSPSWRSGLRKNASPHAPRYTARSRPSTCDGSTAPIPSRSARANPPSQAEETAIRACRSRRLLMERTSSPARRRSGSPPCRPRPPPR